MKDWRLQRLLNIGRWDELTHRHDADSKILADHRRYTGAVYLKGYAVECSLKRLISARFHYQAYPQAPDEQLNACFSGTLGHNLAYLFDLAISDRNLAKKRLRMDLLQFSLHWSVELRYSTIKIDRRAAQSIISMGDKILEACGREGR